jgi:hypothetical protein
MGDNPVRDRGYRFALRLIGVYRELVHPARCHPEERRERGICIW